MLRLKLFLFSFLFTTITIFPQTIYYVSSSQGNDSNSGTSQSSPFKTLDRVNNLTLHPGDKVLFKSGDVWRGQNLIIHNSGTEQNRIMFSAYGSGSKPVLSLREEVPDWNNANNWSKYLADSVWVMNVAGSINNRIRRLWLNNIEYAVASGPNANDDNLDNLGGGNTTYGVNRIHRFYHSSTNGNLYVYSNSVSPVSAYSSIKYAGKINSNGQSISHTFALRDADYVTIDGLDVKGGMYSAVGIGGSKHVIIKNCIIGAYSQFAGIYGNSSLVSASSGTSDYIEINNNIINCDFTVKQHQQLSKSSGVQYGIAVGNGASYWDIHDNYIKNWAMGFLAIAWTAPTLYHDIHNNEITAPDQAYSKSGQISGNAQPGTGSTIGAKVYNNYFHDIGAGLQITSADNKIFYNIFKNITSNTNQHGSQSNSGWGISIINNSLETMKSDNNYIFNNTFYNLNNQALTYLGNNPKVVNNIFANCNLTGAVSHTQVQVNKGSSDIWKNNIFYYSGLNANDPMISMPYVGTFTVAQWNGLNGQYNKTISGNLQFVGNISSLFNTNDFSIPPNSIARNAGVDITSYLPFTLKGFVNTLIGSLTKPNIGAVNNQEEPTGLQIFLEGPYSNGFMSTELNDEGLIPKSQPYNVSPWNYNGNETVTQVPENIVDWVLVELRSALSSSTVVAQKAAFLRNDGSITALDGKSKLSFGNLTNTYYVVIKHRNHLSVMSSLPVLLVSGTLEYDFTTSINKAYGSNAMKDLGNGVFGMFGGDTNGNGVIDDNDVTDVSSNLFKSGYKKEDVDLNSQVNVLDYKLPKNNSSKTSLAVN